MQMNFSHQVQLISFLPFSGIHALHPPNEFILGDLIAFKNAWSIGVCWMACYILLVPSLIDELRRIFGTYSFQTFSSCRFKEIPQHFIFHSFLYLTVCLWFLYRNPTVTISLVHVVRNISSSSASSSTFLLAPLSRANLFLMCAVLVLLFKHMCS